MIRSAAWYSGQGRAIKWTLTLVCNRKGLFNLNMFGMKSNFAAAAFSFANFRLLVIHGQQVARLDLLSVVWLVSFFPPPWRYSYYRDDVKWIIREQGFILTLFPYSLAHCTHVNLNLSYCKLQPNQRPCLKSSPFTFSGLDLAAFPVQTPALRLAV